MILLYFLQTFLAQFYTAEITFDDNLYILSSTPLNKYFTSSTSSNKNSYEA